MEYAKLIDTDNSTGILTSPISYCDSNYMRHIGWEATMMSSEPMINCFKTLFDPKTINFLSLKITELLTGVDYLNRPIQVPNSTICNVLDSVFQNYRPPTGDPITRYNIPKSQPYNMTQDILNQTIEIIVNYVKNSIEMQQNNEKLTIWTTVLGDFNAHQLRQHAPIKILNKRPNPMEFHMKY